MTEVGMRRSTQRLIVFARLPQLGRVKTRLANALGAHSALQIHTQLLNGALDLAQRLPDAQRELRYAGEATEQDSEAARLLKHLRQSDWKSEPQCGSDLGERMHHALIQALRAGQTPVLIGSDCPVFTPEDLADAFLALRSADAVFAPAHDGGYALVGLSREAPELFEQIDWGTQNVMSQTLARAQTLGLRVKLLRTVWDVDTPADVLRWQALRTESPGQ